MPAFDENPTPERPLADTPSADRARELDAEVLRPLEARYQELIEVGRGGMGVVFRAKDRETGDVVALKVLRPEIARRGEAMERFKEELRLARKITHLNVCRTHELLRFGETAVITMEYVEGESLRQILKRFGGVPLRRGLEWARQMCSALGEAHARGIVHRDLKPENVLIDAGGEAKVMDFGIARSLETNLTQTGTILGTPAYMSPEQVEGRPVDQRSDVYSLGLILYEMFTGHVAFRADTAPALALKRLSETPPSPRDLEPYLPAFLERVLLKCVEKDPARRFQTMSELEAALAGRDAAAEPLPRQELPPHLATGQKGDVALLLAGALGFAAFLALANRVIPEAHIQLRVTPQMASNNAREEISRQGWTPSSRPRVLVRNQHEHYRFLAERSGYQAASSRLAEFPTLLFEIEYPRPERPDDAAASVVYEPTGSLQRIRLPVVGWVPPGPGLPRDEALGLAEREFRRVRGIDVSTLQREYEGTLSEEGRNGHAFRWIQADPSGIRWRYQANVFDRLTLLERTLLLPEDYHPRPWSLFGLIAALVLWVPVLVYFVARRLFLRIRRPEMISLGMLSLVAAAGIGLGNPVSPVAPVAVRLLNLFLLCLLFLAWIVVLFGSVSSLFARRWPQWVTTSSALVALRPAPQATGLATLRGQAAGLVLLGVQTLVWLLGISFAHARPPLQELDNTLVSSLPSLTLLGNAIIAGTSLTLLPALAVAVARRLTRQPSLLAAAGGLTYALIATPDEGGWFLLAMTFVMGTLLSSALVLFDLLTLVTAGVTLALGVRLYTMVRISEPVGAGEFWVLLAGWSALFLWAIFAGFRPLWNRAGRRLAELFD
jgi:serine/threonine protein kinase